MSYLACYARIASAAALISFTIAHAVVAVAQDWPQWRGPNREAKASGFQVPSSWPKELKKKWQVSVGEGVSTPALVGGKLYVFSRQAGNEVIRCLDAGNGDEIWKSSYEEQAPTGGASRFPGPRSSPTVADGKVITFGVRGVLCCFDAATGKELWRKDNFPDSFPMFFTSSSPIVVDGVCIAAEGGRDDGGIIAYTLSPGNERWRWMESGPAYGSPALMEIEGVEIVIAPTDSKMVALSLDGKLLWEIPYTQGRYNAASPIIDGSTLIIAGPGTGMTAFRMKMEGDKFVEEKLWTNTDNSIGFNTPVLKDGLIFGLSNANQLFCIDTAAKKTAWSAPIAKPVAAGGESTKTSASWPANDRLVAHYVQFVQQDERDRPPEERRRREFDRGPGRGEGRGRFGPGGFRGRGRGGMGRDGYGSIVDVGPALVALTPAGELVICKPVDEGFSELARYKVADEGTYAYPVPAGSGIYVKDKETITLWAVE